MATGTRRVTVGIIAALGLALALGLYWLDRAAAGIPRFYLWKIWSGQAHGGRYADVNGVRIYYETYGTGRPVLVLHGGTAFIESMHFQITALAQNRLVVAPDSRGHGRSYDGELPMSYGLMADDMLALADRLGLDRFDVVGWSDGGIIGLDLAMHHPERVGRVVAIGANYDSEGLSDELWNHIDDLMADARRFYRLVAPMPARWPILRDKVVAMWRTQPHYTASDLAGIAAPTLLIVGEFDDIKPEHTDRLTAAISGARQLVVKGATHMAPIEQPATVNAAIRDFLDAPLR
jgi:pimeloyl-ACP methyl ester carboxylesterase